jgi:hypothetical protein
MVYTIIGGQHNKAHVAILRGSRFWAENGWIHNEDPQLGHTQFRVRECLLRAKALSEMLGNSSTDDLIRYSDLRKDIQDFLEDITIVCKQAKEQGEYDDPSMARDKQRRAPKSISVPPSFQLD